MKSIKLPERLEYVGKQCFCGSALASIRLPPALKTIEEYTFSGCTNLKTVEFPDGLEKIWRDAFFRSGLENVEFPASLRLLFQGAFAKCEDLKTVKFNEGLEVLGVNEYIFNCIMYYGVFEGSALERVELPSTLKRIEYRVFHGCSNLQSITLPDSLEYVGNQCFEKSGLVTIRVPKAGV